MGILLLCYPKNKMIKLLQIMMKCLHKKVKLINICRVRLKDIFLTSVLFKYKYIEIISETKYIKREIPANTLHSSRGLSSQQSLSTSEPLILQDSLIFLCVKSSFIMSMIFDIIQL